MRLNVHSAQGETEAESKAVHVSQSPTTPGTDMHFIGLGMLRPLGPQRCISERPVTENHSSPWLGGTQVNKQPLTKRQCAFDQLYR